MKWSIVCAAFIGHALLWACIGRPVAELPFPRNTAMNPPRRYVQLTRPASWGNMCALVLMPGELNCGHESHQHSQIDQEGIQGRWRAGGVTTSRHPNQMLCKGDRASVAISVVHFFRSTSSVSGCWSNLSTKSFVELAWTLLCSELLICKRSTGKLLSTPLSSTLSQSCGTVKAGVAAGTHIRGVQAIRPKSRDPNELRDNIGSPKVRGRVDKVSQIYYVDAAQNHA